MTKKKLNSKPAKTQLFFDSAKPAVILFFFSFLIYVNTVGNAYNLDDELVTRKHELTGKGFSGLAEIFTNPYYQDLSGNTYEYRPLVLVSFAIEHQFFGENPHVGHFINTFLYALLIALLYIALKQLFHNYNSLLPFVAALLFAAHPIHTEVVASLKNRDEIMALLFGVCALLFSFKYTKSNQYKYLILTVIFFLFGLLTKKSILPFAAIIPLSNIIFFKPEARHLFLLTLLPGLIAAALSHFYYINARIFMVFAIMGFNFLVWLIVNPVIKKDLRSFFTNNFALPKGNIGLGTEQKNLAVFDVLVLAGTFVLCLSGFFMKSAVFFAFVFIANVLLFLFSLKRNSSLLLLSAFVPALMLLVFSGMYVQMYFMVIFLALIFNKKNSIHHIIAAGIIIVHILLVKTLLLFLAYYFLLIIPVVIYRLRLKFHLHKISAVFLLLVMAFVNFVSGNFESDVLFFFLSSFTLLVVFFLADYVSLQSKAWLLIPIVTILLLPGEIAYFQKRHNPVINITAVNINEVADILPASGRQLDFAEMPVNRETPLNIRLGTSFVAMAYYIKLLVLPHPLGFYYGYNMLPVVGIGNQWALIAFLLHIVIFAAGFYYLRKQPIPAFGILYYLIAISIFSNIAAPVAGLIGERLAFTASLGVCIVLAFLLFRIFKMELYKTSKPQLKIPFVLVLSLIVFLYSFKTISRNKDWENHLTLFEKDLQYLSRSAHAHNLYANALIMYMAEEQDTEKRKQMINNAISAYEKALDIYPDFYNASFDMGKAFYFTEKYQFALNAFERNLSLDSSDYMVHMYVALCHENMNNYDAAVFHYEKSTALAPLFADAYTNLGALFLKLTRPQDALLVYESYLKLVPTSYEHLLNSGKIYFNMGMPAEALPFFEKAFAIDASDKMLINALFEIHKNLGNDDEAAYYNRLLHA